LAQTVLLPRPTLQDPEPEPPTRGSGRRDVRFRDALLTLLVALGLWAILFSPALERSAETAPVGARRTAALAVLRPLSALSDALGLSGVSEAAMAALGRDADAAPGGELDLDELDLPPLPPLDVEPDPPPLPPQGVTSPSPPPATEEPQERPDGGDGEAPGSEPEAGIRVPTPESKLRVAVVGDSLSQGLGPAIERWLRADVSRVLSLGRQSTGLARQDYFNWRWAMRQIEDAFRPDLVFVLLGSNDDQSQVAPDGSAVRVGSAAWVRAYRERATAFLSEATSNGTHVVWVGIPVVQDHGRWDFYRRVNDLYRQTAEGDPLATYLDAWKLFQTRAGRYSAYLRNEQGALQQMRAGDGLHLTPDGYDYLARHAIRAAAQAFALPQRAASFRI
jgi:hypothetical protein